MSFWYCNTCLSNISHGDFIYNCTICEGYGECELCYEDIARRHSHPMVQGLAFGYGNESRDNMTDMTSFIRTAFDVYADRHCFGVRDMESSMDQIYANSYSWMSFQTVGNRPEWVVADFACILHSIITVPMYYLFSDREIVFVVNNTNIAGVVCDKAMLPTFLRLGSQCPKLRHLICMDTIFDTVTQNPKEDGSSLHYMEKIEVKGSTKSFEYAPTKPDVYITIMYTSRTSGFPKGVMIPEQAFRENFEEVCMPYSMERVLLSYRPLARDADRNTVFSVFLFGGRTGFTIGDMSRLMEEITLVRPTSFSPSPSIWNKIYSEFQCELALAISYQHMDREEAEQQLLEKFSKLMPNRCKVLVIGGAMVSPVLLSFMSRCYPRCEIIKSYSSTECGGTTFDSSLCLSVDYRLESVSEMGYTIDDQSFLRGELLVKSMELFSSYVNNSEETKAAITDDGFFRTGDIVELRIQDNQRPNIYVIDQKKNFFKLANGQFVSPEYLQGIYMPSPYIEQIYIHGDSMDNHVIAVVVPNKG